MSRTLLRSVSYCLAAALPLTVVTTADTFADQPDHASGKGARSVKQILPKRILHIESQGARAFGGIKVFNPADPSGSRFLSCDHGYVDWQIPPRARKTPLVFTHGSGTRVYQTTYDGKPGMQQLFLGEGYPTYVVDLPGTGRAGQGCVQYTYTPNLNANTVFENRIGTWPLGQPQPTYFPGVAFSRDPEALNQDLRTQYPEFNGQAHVEVEATGLAVLLEDIYAEGRGKSIVFSHSSGGVRGFRVGLKTDKVAGHVSFEPANAFFPEGEEPMIKRTDGTLVPAANSPSVPLQEFIKLTKYPQLIIWGDNIPREVDPSSTTEPALSVRAERFKLMAAAINKYGGNAVNLYLTQEGVFGNTHRIMADTNYGQVTYLIEQWIEKEGLVRPEKDGHGRR